MQTHSTNKAAVEGTADLSTAPELLLHHASVRGDRTAMREKAPVFKRHFGTNKTIPFTRVQRVDQYGVLFQ